MSPRHCERYLRILLIATGLVMLLAFTAMVMPRGWMAAIHAWLGLGPFPDQPIATYLARTTSGLYGLLGVLLLLGATDVRRYSAMIATAAAGIAGLAVVAMAFAPIDGMPWWWSAGDAASAWGFAAIVLVLQWKARRVLPKND